MRSIERRRLDVAIVAALTALLVSSPPSVIVLRAAVAVGTVYPAEDVTDQLSVSVTLAAGEVGYAANCWRLTDDETLASDPGATFNSSSTGVTRIVLSNGISERVGFAAWYVTGVTGTGVNFSVDYDNAPDQGSRLVFVRLTGVDTGSIQLDSDTATDLGGELGTLSNNSTGLDANDLILASICTVGNTVASMTPGASQTTVDAANVVSTDATMMVTSKTGTGTVATSYTYDGPTGWFARLNSWAVNGSAGGAAAAPKLTLLGVGDYR